MKRIGLVVLVCLCTVMPGAESDWPQFRGPTGQGISTDKGLPATWSATENVLWKVALPGPGTSTPIIIGPRIYLTYYSGVTPGGKGDLELLKLHLLCLDRANGNKIWDKEIVPKLPEQATIRENHGYASNTPAADAERVYAFFGKSGVIAFDHKGTQLWEADVGSKIHGWGSAASPVLYEDLVIVNASVESESVVALNKKDGKEVWRVPAVKESWNTPIVVSAEGGKNELVVAMMGKVLGMEPRTGQKLWSCATDIPWYMVPSVVENAGTVYCIGGRTGGGLAVRTGGKDDVTASHRVWKSKKGSNVTSPIYYDGHLYWMHENQGIAYCAEVKTGNIVYEQKIERADQIYASPVLGDGKIYYVSRSGRTYVIAAKPEFQQLAANDLGERATYNASPAIAGGKIFLRSDKTLFCLGQK